MYENCGVKNYMKEDHRSYRRNRDEPLTSAVPVQRSTN